MPCRYQGQGHAKCKMQEIDTAAMADCALCVCVSVLLSFSALLAGAPPAAAATAPPAPVPRPQLTVLPSITAPDRWPRRLHARDTLRAAATVLGRCCSSGL
jgi:hypothetical protein